MTIVLGSDHAGFALRRILAARLLDEGHAVREYGATDESAYDYPDAACEVAVRVQKGEADFGILVCGTGIGMAITANKFRGVRAATCWSEDAARLAREHNHANILCIGARLIDPELAIQIMDIFLSTPPSEEERHVRRVRKINELPGVEASEAPC
ncbi:MAG: ribose 5-phosphate isomerase B [Armatimonadetes bacterium]|nr:MAG: ribose 5-phosphate isomerase B [Armatimonadota bacterium]